jgi:hypothetical protein
MIALHPEDWASVIGQDLAEFVGAGGALVRFVVGETPADIGRARQALRALADESQLHFFDVDGSQTRLHYPNDILAAIAERIDFPGVMTSFLLRAVIEGGLELPHGTTEFAPRDIAEFNGVSPKAVRELVNDRIRSGIMRDPRLVRDVRYALFALSQDLQAGRLEGKTGDLPTRWLTSRVTGIKELRDSGIVQKVTRYNARGLLRSILTWLPTSQWKGSIVFVNALQLGQVRNLRDGRVHYTRAALSDVYEVMREFIDETDDMSHVMLVFAMPDEFLSIDPRGRGVGMYQALQFRVNGFPDAKNPNPLSNMVLTSSSATRRSFSA